MRAHMPERPPDFERGFASCQIEVRDALAALRRALTRAAFDPCDISSAEIVLAEVLNNIVEHGYGGGPGPVELQVWLEARAAVFVVTDAGTPLPGGRLPAARAPALAAPEALPEGGFGWPLIHSLTDEITYETGDGRNRLRGRIPRRHRAAAP